jgi:hypothetical protein
MAPGDLGDGEDAQLQPALAVGSAPRVAPEEDSGLEAHP